MPADSLTDLQNQLKTLLGADTDFAGLQLITEAKGDVVKAAKLALDETFIAVVIMAPELRVSAEVPNRSLVVRQQVSVLENVVLNRKRANFRTAPGLCIAAMNAVWNSGTPWTPAGGWCAAQFEPGDGIELVSHETHLEYAFTFTIKIILA